MEIIQICPKCGQPAVSVDFKTVEYNLIDSAKPTFESNLKWSICSNLNCECSYFSKYQIFTITDLIKPLFFKDNSDNVPICYCSDLTRGEIKNAVRQGMRTIDDVQRFTQKNITGLCEERNPLGKCCRNVFLKTISDNNVFEQDSKCCCCK
jgi:bacterioferritin-associated ferredoxin